MSALENIGVKLPSYIARANPKVAKDGGQHHAYAQGVRLGGESDWRTVKRSLYCQNYWYVENVKNDKERTKGRSEFMGMVEAGKRFSNVLIGAREKFFQIVWEPLIQKMLWNKVITATFRINSFLAYRFNFTFMNCRNDISKIIKICMHMIKLFCFIK